MFMENRIAVWMNTSIIDLKVIGIENSGYVYMGPSVSIDISATVVSGTAYARTTGIENVSGSFAINRGRIICDSVSQSINQGTAVAQANGINQMQGDGVVEDGYIEAKVSSTGARAVQSGNAVTVENGSFELKEGTISGGSKGLYATGGIIKIGVDDNTVDTEYPFVHGKLLSMDVAEQAQVELYDGAIGGYDKVRGSFVVNKYVIPVQFLDKEEVLGEANTVWGQPVGAIKDPVKRGNIFKTWNAGRNVYNFDTPVCRPLTLYAEWEPILITGIRFDKPEFFVVEGNTLALPISYYPEEHGDDTTLTWKSNNEQIVAIESGMPKAKGVGTTTVTATLANNSSKSTTCKVTVLKKVLPVESLKATGSGKNQVELTWTGSKDATGYLIYAQKAGKYGYCGMTTQRTSFKDTKALDSEYNFYWVFPYVADQTGKMYPGGCTKYVYAKGITKAVTDLKAVGQSGSVKLTWSVSVGAEGYLVYGKTASGAYGYKGMTTQGTVFVDKKAAKDEYNFYWVFPYHKDKSGKMIVGGTPLVLQVKQVENIFAFYILYQKFRKNL